MNNVFMITSFLPEIVLLVGACIALLTDAFAPKKTNAAYYLCQLSLVIAAIISFYGMPTETITQFHGAFVLDKFAVSLKLFSYVAVFLTFIYSRRYVCTQKIPQGEYYVLGLLSTLGILVLISAGNFISLYLGLELMSLPIYAMVALERERARCLEAAMKYFVMGSLASGLLLYGLSLLFGVSHSVDLSVVAEAISQHTTQELPLLILGMVFIVAGIAFKFGAAPFHFWVPDVYDGAPSSVTLFISAAPKLAAFGLSIRLLVDAMPALHIQWQEVLVVIAIASMAIGNIVAIAQTNIKRMLAYSSIAHMGYMILGLATGTSDGYGAAMFYIVSYTLMSLGAFGMIVLMSKEGYEPEAISDFAGLNTRNPWLAFMWLLILFSMAGIPPLVGFIAKVGLLEALINVHMTWLAVLAILFAIIGAYYYLRVVKVIYFEEPKEVTPVFYTRTEQVAISLNGLAVLVLGILPGWLFVLSHGVL
ncbi:MAG TPA: NADH-quinone oxidoreductase subunit NuoN [Coxiellaceae bacterium]|nr:NADH-quinone oxidoreductase subunit NuoN [Coxiellaceae bacterium]